MPRLLWAGSSAGLASREGSCRLSRIENPSVRGGGDLRKKLCSSLSTRTLLEICSRIFTYWLGWAVGLQPSVLAQQRLGAAVGFRGSAMNTPRGPRVTNAIAPVPSSSHPVPGQDTVKYLGTVAPEQLPSFSL